MLPSDRASGYGTADTLQVIWSEAGGPPLTGTPARTGFGSVILTKLTAAALQGNSTIEFRPAGLQWTLHAPLPAITSEIAAESAIVRVVDQPGQQAAA